MGTIYRHIRVEELEAFGKSEDYARFSTLPISSARILSQALNPRADPMDIALIFAVDERNELLGFVGLLPDLILSPYQQKVFWISCWWVDKIKGKNLGVPLLLLAYKASQGKLIADSIPATIPIFKASKLFHIPDAKAGLRVFLKPCLKKVLNRKRPHWKLTQLVGLGDSLLNGITYPLYWMIKKRTAKNVLQHTRHLLINKEQETFLDRAHGKEHFQRGIVELNWILSYPWIGLATHSSSTYYPFSSIAKHFQNHVICLQHEDQQVAMLFFTEREHSFKLHYAYFDYQYEDRVAQFIEAFLYHTNAEEFTTFHPSLSKSLSKKFKFAYQRPVYYQYVWGKDLSMLHPSHLQYGDGDAIFT